MIINKKAFIYSAFFVAFLIAAYYAALNLWEHTAKYFPGWICGNVTALLSLKLYNALSTRFTRKQEPTHQ